ncbi:histidine phosphatase family protein [Actinomycetospora cinnamomea]|uniref:Putative phosphoglycerate mutase n=1 Tax=Actinomycetospora cinnamomea TaxID=663609 RepID=A0A2U1FIU3_9PSEU|nr:histidine phosphatase family protein [Actinomycetospora cinnamomea]PVZ12113.1 putative phosphoglycerate mutase [Actinomycetospora cinnamomea]
MQLLLVRHAEPLAADATDGVGADPALSPRGSEQAETLGRWVAGTPDRHAIAEVVVSPMRRARETAAPAAAVLGLEPVVVDDLAEFDRGRASYRPVHERDASDPDWQAIRAGRFPSFVDADAFAGRVRAAVDGIVERHGRRDTVLVVCHAGVINTYLTGLLGLELPLYFPLEHVSLSRVLVSGDGRRRVRSVNETQHVEDLR